MTSKSNEARIKTYERRSVEAHAIIAAQDQVAALKQMLEQAEQRLMDALNEAGYNNGHPRSRYYRTLNNVDALRTMKRIAQRQPVHTADCVAPSGPAAWSARCDCRNGHNSNSGRCRVTDVTDPTHKPGEVAICERCRIECGGQS